MIVKNNLFSGEVLTKKRIITFNLSIKWNAESNFISCIDKM